ncbi:MAG: hypothetical protein WA736_16610, partial [Candidatus Acidiferrum sp.]
VENRGGWRRRLRMSRKQENQRGKKRDSQSGGENTKHLFILAEKGARAYLWVISRQEFVAEG